MMFMRGWTRTSDEEAEAEQIVAGAVGPQQQQQQSRRRQRPQASSSQSPPPTHQRYDSLGDMSDLTSEGIAHLQMQMPSNGYHLRSARSPAASPPASASASVISPAASSQASATPPAPAPSPAPASSPPQPEKEGGTAPSPAAQKRLLARLDAAEVAAAQLTDTSLTEEYSQSSEWSTSAGSPATTPDRSRLLRRGGSANSGSGSGRSSASSSPAQDSIGFAYADDIYAYTDDGAASLSAGSGSGSLDGAAALPLPSSFAAHPAAATPARPAAARSPARTRAKAVSPSPPRHAVEFRRRAHPAARGPVPPLRQAWSFDQATPTRQRYYYETDGRTLGGTVLDVEDPYLSSGSEGAARAAAEEVWRPRMDMQVDMDEDVDAGGGDREAGWRDLRRRSPARHVYGYVGDGNGDGDGDCAPILTPTTSATPSKLRRAPGFDLHPPARGAGSLSVARILRALLVLGAAGGAANLLRAHLLLADLYLPAGSAKAASAAAGRGPYSQSPAAPRPPPRLRGGSATVTRVRTAAGGSALLLPFRPPASAPPAAARMFGVAGPVSGSGSHYAEELREERTAMAGAMKAAAGFDGRGTEAPPPTYSARILPTPGRADLTDAAVARLAACPRGAEVRVGREGDGDWSSTSSWRAAGTAGRPTTDAVLLLGDDLALTCEELDRGECDNLPLVFSFLLLRLMIRFHCVA